MNIPLHQDRRCTSYLMFHMYLKMFVTVCLHKIFYYRLMFTPHSARVRRVVGELITAGGCYPTTSAADDYTEHGCPTLFVKCRRPTRHWIQHRSQRSHCFSQRHYAHGTLDQLCDALLPTRTWCTGMARNRLTLVTVDRMTRKGDTFFIRLGE